MIQWIKLIVVNSDHMLLVSMRLIFAYHTYTDSTLVLRYIYMLLYGIFYINRWIEYIYSLSWLNISNAHPLLLATLVPMGKFKTQLQGFARGYSLSCMTRTVFLGYPTYPHLGFVTWINRPMLPAPSTSHTANLVVSTQNMFPYG